LPLSISITVSPVFLSAIDFIATLLFSFILMTPEAPNMTSTADFLPVIMDSFIFIFSPALASLLPDTH
jgi:hypothetical protein